MMTEFQKLDGTGSGGGTDPAMFNIAEYDVFSLNDDTTKGLAFQLDELQMLNLSESDFHL